MFSDVIEVSVMVEKTLKIALGMEDSPRSGLPTECRSNENIEKVHQLLCEICNLTLRLPAENLKFSRDTVRKVVVQDLRKRVVVLLFFYML